MDDDRRSTIESETAPGTLLCLVLALYGVTLLPFTLCTPLPLADYPNHLARMYINEQLPTSTDLARYYSIQWELLPNLALDLVVPALATVMSVETAMVVFAALTLLIIATGAIALNLVLFNRRSLWPLAIFLLLYNRQFLWGFLNFLFTSGLMLWVFAAWVHFRERNPRTRLLLFAIPATTLYVGHLYPYAIYAIVIGGYEIGRGWQRFRQHRQAVLWDWMTAGAQFVPGIVLFLTASSTKDRAEDVIMSSPYQKAAGLVDIFNNYSLSFDILTLLLLGGLYIAGILMGVLRVHRLMWLPLLMLAAVYAALPRVIFYVYNADRRLIPAFAILLVASTDLRTNSRRVRAAAAAVLGVLFVARIVIISVVWANTDGVYQKYIEAIDQIDRGSRLAILVASPESPALQNPPIDHIGCLAVLRKDAFVNSMFADRGQHTLHVLYNTDTRFYRSPSQSFRLRGELLERGVPNVYGRVPLQRFDWVLIINQRFFPGQPPPILTVAWQDQQIDTVLYRVSGDMDSATVGAGHLEGSHFGDTSRSSPRADQGGVVVPMETVTFQDP